MVLIYANGPLQQLFWGSRRGRSSAAIEKATSALGDKFVVQPQMIIGVSFLLFSCLMMFNTMGLLAYRATFKPADVDVLFPTPISPKLMLGVKMVRDTLLTMMIPLVLMLIGGGSLLGTLKGGATSTSLSGITTALSLAFPMYLLTSAVFVCFGYGVGLYLSRPSDKTEIESKTIGWLLAILNSAFIGYVGYLFVVTGDFMLGVQAFQTPLNKVIFFPAWGATQVMGLGAGTSSASAIFAVVGFISAIVVGVVFAMSQSKYLLEVSALRAAEMGEIMAVAKTGNSSAFLAYRAKQGKIKVKRIQFLETARWNGPWALVWRELVISYRTGLKILLLLPYLVLVGVFAVKVFGQLPSRGQQFIGWASAGGIAYMAFIAGMAQRTMIDLLKRSDTIKPLPFNSTTTVYFEVIGRTLVQLASVAFAFLIGAILFPLQWEAHVAGAYLMPCLIVLLIVTQMMIMIVFPDVEDVTQRGFTGLMQLLGMAIVLAIPIGVFLLSFLVVKAGILVSSAGASVSMLLISFVVASIAARLYEGFNPSD